MEEMFGDLHLAQCNIPGSFDSDGAPIMKPHFLSIILEPSLHLRRLMIPTKFRKNHESTLLEHAFLRVPNGKEHKVKLTTDKDGNVWFSHGWEDFAGCYSLAFGSFLLFRYEESSRFHVFVFDMSCTEIEYPNFTGTIDEDDDEEEKEDDQGEDEFNEAEKRARAFKCDNPHFVSLMRSTYLKAPDFRMWVPAKYAKKHMMKAKNKKIVLGVEGGQGTWRVSYTCETARPPRVTVVRLATSGWRSFAIDNGLQVGDACVFELIDHKAKANVYKVHIFRKEP